MKKLIIAMSAATMAALCAQAAQIGYTEGFEGRPKGPLDVETADDGTASGDKLWARATDKDGNPITGDSEVVLYEQVENGNNKFLKVDETGMLTRNAAVDENGAAVAQGIPANGGDITVAAKVQFTAADEDQTAADGDKLLVWAKAPADSAESQDIKLMVTDKSGARETDMVVTADTWYNLEIVAVATGKEDTASASFTVKIAEAGQTPAAVTIDGKVATFVSCLDQGDAAAQTITSIGFKGTGAVDDIGFVANEGVETEKFTYTVNISDAMAELLTSVTVQYDDADPVEWDGTAKELVVGTAKKVTIVITPSEGDKVANANADKGENGSYTIEVDVSAAKANENLSINIEVVKDQGGTVEPENKPEIVTGDGQTVEAVVAAANSATGIVVKNCTADDVTINGTTIKVGETTVTIPAYYTARFDATASKITLTLNENALEEETAVSVGAANLGLTISTSKAKLWYGLATGTTVNGQYTAPTTLVQGTGNALTLTAEKNGNACFYRLYVTDIAPTPAN